MSGSALSAKFFHDEKAAYVWLEGVIWPNGPVCPHCGCSGRITVVGGKTARMGLKRCLDCKKQFTVTVGTVFERTRVALNLWLQAAHLLCSSKKGMSSHQIHRILGVTYKTAWFMTHRLREAMRDGHFPAQLGGDGAVVEADETYVGGKEKNKHQHKKLNAGRGAVGKEPVLSLVETRRQGPLPSRRQCQRQDPAPDLERADRANVSPDDRRKRHLSGSRTRVL